jgi:alpha-ketoglutarate-dependent 2,4-dichlorophenoxyacetate dioxygenase
MECIVGKDEAESRQLLDELAQWATQSRFTCSHAWREGDVVMWDNRRTMHRARRFPPEEPRDMRRTTLRGDGPTAEQAA